MIIDEVSATDAKGLCETVQDGSKSDENATWLLSPAFPLGVIGIL